MFLPENAHLLCELYFDVAQSYIHNFTIYDLQFSLVYRLVMVTYFNGVHYIAKVMYQNQWYIYDGCKAGMIKTSISAQVPGYQASTLIYKVFL